MDLKIQSLIILLIIFIKILLIPGISSIRNEPLDIEQMNTINKFQMIFLLFYLLFLPLIAYDSKKMPLIILLMGSIIGYIAMIMMIIFKSKKTETIYCKAFCKDKTKNKKELVTFFEGLDPTNTASAFLLIFYLAECLYLMMFGVIAFIDMNKNVKYTHIIMFLACLAGALIVTSMVLHSTDINLGTMCKKKCASKGLYEKKNTCKGQAK